MTVHVVARDCTVKKLSEDGTISDLTQTFFFFFFFIISPPPYYYYYYLFIFINLSYLSACLSIFA